MSNLFQSTPKLKEGARVINGLDKTVLAKILKRVCQELDISIAFSGEEIIKMHETLELNKQQVEIMLQTLSFIIQQAAYHLIKPALLIEHLKGFGIDESSSAVISEIWGSQAKSIVDKLKKGSIVPNKVEDLESSLHFQLSSHINGQVKIPLALIHLNFGQSAANESNLTLEFNQQELQQFYQTLEAIQAQLDQII